MPTYVIGHKNPDTDSICAAIALADLKRELGEDCVAARIGVLNPETEFILKKVGVKPPIYLKTAKNTLNEITVDEAVIINGKKTLRDGWDKLMEKNTKTLFVVDDNGDYEGLVTLGDISSIQMQDLNITKDLLKATPIDNLASAVHGQVLLEGTKERSGEVRISDKKMMDRDLTGAIMILNDHEDIMIKAMSKDAAVIIVAENYVPDDFIFEMAKSKGVSIINTPYNIMKIIQMIYRSIPIEFIMTPKEFMITFTGTEYIENVEKEMLKTRHSSYPVVEKNKVVGSVARYHLLKAEKKKFILVDHNETKQSIDDIEKGEIVEVVDHHRIGDIETDKPIIFRNMIVGSSCTIVGLMYQEYGIRMSEKVAKLIAYAIISDTMNFHSPTCTQIDKLLAARLEVDYNLDFNDMAEELFKNTATIKDKEYEDILYNDSKPFDIDGFHVRISQVFVFDFHDVEKIKDSFEHYMNEEIRKTNLDLWLMVFTNVEGKGSRIFHVGKLSPMISETIDKFEQDGYVSRKKEIVPGLAKALA